MAPLVVVHFEVVCLGRKTSPNFPDVPLRVYHLSLSGRQRGHARLGLLRASRIFGSRKNARKVGLGCPASCRFNDFGVQLLLPSA